jgi:hypothetical protein
MIPLKTPTEYARLAYKKAITARVASFLHQQFLGDEMSDPVEVLTSDEVFPADAVVPPEEIQAFIEELSDKEASLSSQLRRFSLVKDTKNEPRQQRAVGKRRVR